MIVLITKNLKGKFKPDKDIAIPVAMLRMADKIDKLNKKKNKTNKKYKENIDEIKRFLIVRIVTKNVTIYNKK